MSLNELFYLILSTTFCCYYPLSTGEEMDTEGERVRSNSRALTHYLPR